MLFPTTDFAVFFCLVFLGHWWLNHNARAWKAFMIAASYVFYGWWNWRYVFLLAGVSLITQLAAIAVSHQVRPPRRMAVLGLGVAATIAPLVYFKYYGFFTVNVTNAATSLGLHVAPPLIQVVLPVGVSFYTFMAIAYVVDIYRGDFELAGWTYCDFSGYTDIAIGVAKLLGFRFPQNFDRPYSARSVQEFWRRWHMTLSRWLRDYLYIPLGGNRKGTARTYVNLMITMLLGGLWHGAAWHFVAWGGLHGAYLAAGHWKQGRREAGALAEPTDTVLVHWLQRLMTFILVCIAWTLFRADSVATA